MRILHILDHSVPLQSGYTFRTLSILRAQRAFGWETLHLTGPKHQSKGVGPELVDELEFHRTPQLPAPLERVTIVNEMALMARLARRLRDVARATGPDILHAHSPVLNAWPALWVGRRLGLPVVYEVRAFWEDAAASHGTSRENGLRYRVSQMLETAALRRAEAVTTICDGLRDDIVRRGIAADKVTVIPNGVDVGVFRPGRPPDAGRLAAMGLEGCAVLGFFGSFYGYEGLDILIEALPAIRKEVPNVKLVLAGGGPEDSNLRARVAELGLEDVTVFCGRVPHAEISDYYDLVDVFVFPRRSIRLTELVTPLKPLEAMAQERIVLASDVGGHRELVQDGVTGFLFRSDDPGALADKVIDVLRRRAEWDAMRQSARRYVETERAWPRIVERYAAVYENAICKRTR